MSAHTGRREESHAEREERVGWLDNLVVLFTLAYTCIREGKRSKTMTQALLKALQLFKENRLLTVLAMDPNQTTLSDDDLQKRLSLLIADLPGFPRELLTYFAERGVRYIGEIYKLKWDRRGRGVLDTRKQVMDYLATLNLPAYVDVDRIWRPSYWDDAGFMAALNRPIGQVVNNIGDYRWRHFRSWRQNPDNVGHFCNTRRRRLHHIGIHYGGQYLVLDRKPAPRSIGSWGVGQIKDLQSSLQADCGLWAAALVPPDWTSPTEVPAEWTGELKLIVQEQGAARVEQQRREAEEREQQMQEAAEEARRAEECASSEDVMEASALNPVTFVMCLERGDLDVLFYTVEDWELTVRMANCLQNASLKYVGQLVQKTEVEMLKSKNFGRKCLKEVKEELAMRELRLGMFVREPVRTMLKRAIELRAVSLSMMSLQDISARLREEFQIPQGDPT